VSVPYSVIIQWSDEDSLYVASLPEFGPYARTHGATYEEAARQAQEALELLMETFQVEGRPLPRPLTLQSAPDLARTIECAEPAPLVTTS
jgi:predicted RNase H-like HicB family nuclease